MPQPQDAVAPEAEGAQPLADDWVDLAQVIWLTIGEFERDPRLLERRMVSEIAPARVRGDLDAVGLAIRNLVENALVHGARGQVIRIACRSTPKAAILAVIDDGRGVSGDDIRSLAKRFARGGGAAGSGTGLGLSIVETMARRMGAKLVLRSPPEGKSVGFEARLVWDLTLG